MLKLNWESSRSRKSQGQNWGAGKLIPLHSQGRLTVAGYSLQGQQAASSWPLSRNQEAKEIHHPFAPVLPNNAAAEGSLVWDKDCIIILT